MSSDSARVLRFKRMVPLALVASAALFFLLLAFPAARQSSIFPYDELCDYRMFIRPTMQSERPYEPKAVVYPRDACYPPIAYCAVGALASDRGEKWSLAAGERRLVVSIFLLQLLGALVLTRRLPGWRARAAAALAILASPACICSVLRGNPSGWAFALVCVFLCWYESESRTKRMVAALALGAATALKVAPCLFGLLYLEEVFRAPRRLRWTEILVAAAAAVVLVFVPFAFFGGFGAVPHWIANARANADFYSRDNPLWGLVAFANHVIDSPEPELPCAGAFAMATRLAAAALALASLAPVGRYRRLLFIGAAMACMTHHDYGGAYLAPAFIAWLADAPVARKGAGVALLLEAVAWFAVFTPLQLPNPLHDGSMNSMLQNEFLFVLLACALVPVPREPPRILGFGAYTPRTADLV